MASKSPALGGRRLHLFDDLELFDAIPSTGFANRWRDEHAVDPRRPRQHTPCRRLRGGVGRGDVRRLSAFVDVILPQTLPGIISTTLFTFILAWNEYLYALVLTNADSAKTLPPGVMTILTSSYNIEWGMLMAASVLISLPLILSFAFMQRHLTRGFGAGAVKG